MFHWRTRSRSMLASATATRLNDQPPGRINAKSAYTCRRARIRAPRRCHCRSTQAQHASNIVAAQLRPLLPRRQRDADGTHEVSIEAFADFSSKRVRCHATYPMPGASPMRLHGRFCCSRRAFWHSTQTGSTGRSQRPSTASHATATSQTHSRLMSKIRRYRAQSSYLCFGAAGFPA
jgi:hypothetical protein